MELAPSFRAAVDRFAVVSDRTAPISQNTEFYRSLGAIHRDARDRTDPLYQRISSLTG